MKLPDYLGIFEQGLPALSLACEIFVKWNKLAFANPWWQRLQPERRSQFRHMSKIYQKGREIFADPVSLEGGSKEDSSSGYLSFFRDKKQPDGTYDLTHLWQTEDGEEDAMVRFCNMEERKWIEDAREEGIVSEARLIQLLAKAFRLKTRSIRQVIRLSLEPP